jgi:hypothetical protein
MILGCARATVQPRQRTCRIVTSSILQTSQACWICQPSLQSVLPVTERRWPPGTATRPGRPRADYNLNSLSQAVQAWRGSLQVSLVC